MKYKIEKKVPLPEATGGRKSKYPWSEMEVGDSIFFQHDRARTAAIAWSKRHNVEFTTRKEKKGYRIWRTK